jgi:hypothetical protein
VTSQISIDGNPAQFLNLKSPAGGGGNQDVASTVVWGVEQLSKAPHNVVVSMAPGGAYVKVDAFMCAPSLIYSWLLITGLQYVQLQQQHRVNRIKSAIHY